MINWNDNAKAAIYEYDKFIKENYGNQGGYAAHFCEQSTQKKTVADAVEHYNGVWPSSEPKIDKIKLDVKRGELFPDFGEPCNENFYIVCTREQFEAYVKEQEQPNFKATRENLEKIAKDAQGDFVEVEQESEKWTHTCTHFQPCRIEIEKPDEHGFIVIYVKGDGYMSCEPDEIKPIKTTISEDAKRQLELYVQYRVDKYGDHDMKSDLSDYLSHHDII